MRNISKKLTALVQAFVIKYPVKQQPPHTMLSSADLDNFGFMIGNYAKLPVPPSSADLNEARNKLVASLNKAGSSSWALSNDGFQLNVVNPSASAWAIDAASEQQPISAFSLMATSPARGAGVFVPLHPVFGLLPGAYASLDLGALPVGSAPGPFGAFPFDQVQ